MALPLPQRRPSTRRSLDLGAIVLAPLGIAVILLAQVIGGVPAAALVQWEAALIVFGGTLGAVLLSFSPREAMSALQAAGRTFQAVRDDVDGLSATIIALAGRAHRRGLITIETDVENVSEPFLREGVKFAIDEASLDALKELLAVESAVRSAEEEGPARLFEAAAGYAPTLGILGAVLGLIDVMRHLSAPAALGSGIAVAFVATVYGVGVANLVLLPLAGRLRERSQAAIRRRELMTHGICAIHQRVHPRILGHKLRAFGARPAAVEDRSARFARADKGRRLPA